jgi:hypothetical protein
MTVGRPDAGPVATPTEGDARAHLFRLAQARRLLRFCGEQGLDCSALIAGTVVADLGPICDEGGRVLPEPTDLDAIGGLAVPDGPHAHVGPRWGSV